MELNSAQIAQFDDQGYLLAMCLKHDFGHRQLGRELEKVTCHHS